MPFAMAGGRQLRRGGPADGPAAGRHGEDPGRRHLRHAAAGGVPSFPPKKRWVELGENHQTIGMIMMIDSNNRTMIIITIVIIM